MTCPNCLSQWLLSHPGSWSIIEIAPSESSILWLLMGDSRSGTKLDHMFVYIGIYCKHHIGCPPETWIIFQTVLVVLFLPRRTWWLDLPNATPGGRIFLMGSPWESGSNDAITYSAKTHLWHAQGGGSERYPSFKWKAKEDASKSKLVDRSSNQEPNKRCLETTNRKAATHWHTDCFFCCYKEVNTKDI